MAGDGGYYLSMYDPRVTMSMIFLYGKACAEQDHERAGVLYAQLSRAIQEDEEAPRPISEENRRGVEVRVSGSSYDSQAVVIPG